MVSLILDHLSPASQTCRSLSPEDITASLCLSWISPPPSLVSSRISLRSFLLHPYFVLAYSTSLTNWSPKISAPLRPSAPQTNPASPSTLSHQLTPRPTTRPSPNSSPLDPEEIISPSRPTPARPRHQTVHQLLYSQPLHCARRSLTKGENMAHQKRIKRVEVLKEK